MLSSFLRKMTLCDFESLFLVTQEDSRSDRPEERSHSFTPDALDLRPDPLTHVRFRIHV